MSSSRYGTAKAYASWNTFSGSLELKFFTLPQRKIYVENYDYPYERVTYQAKKTYRTIIRRKLRAIMEKLDNTE